MLWSFSKVSEVWEKSSFQQRIENWLGRWYQGAGWTSLSFWDDSVPLTRKRKWIHSGQASEGENHSWWNHTVVCASGARLGKVLLLELQKYGWVSWMWDFKSVQLRKYPRNPVRNCKKKSSFDTAHCMVPVNSYVQSSRIEGLEKIGPDSCPAAQVSLALPPE